MAGLTADVAHPFRILSPMSDHVSRFVSDAPAQAVTLASTLEWQLAAANGGLYRVMVSLPTGPAPAAGFPVVYLLDANGSFGTMVETLRRGCARPEATALYPAVIVGIDHPVAGGYDRARRLFDYTHGPANPPAPEMGSGPVGGAQAFLDFIVSEVQPRVAGLVSVDGRRQTLMGHSLAAYFVLDTLVHRPDVFAWGVAISPSVWWNRDRLLAGLAARGPDAVPLRAFLGVGQWEQELAPYQRLTPEAAAMAQRRGQRLMVDGTRDFALALAQACGQQAPANPDDPEDAGGAVSYLCFTNEDHASVLAVSITRALRFAMAR